LINRAKGKKKDDKRFQFESFALGGKIDMAEWGFKALFAVTLLLVLGLGGVGIEGKIQLTKQPKYLFPPSPSSIPSLDP
jgi:hypothetical protein